LLQTALAYLSGNSLWARITQLNGLPLLVLLGMLVFMYILIRWAGTLTWTRFDSVNIAQ
jgi:hypothetical protein